MRQFRIVLFTGAPAPAVIRLVRRLCVDAPEIRIAAVVYETRRPKALPRRVVEFIQHLPDAEFRSYVAARIGDAVAQRAVAAGERLLRWMHAAPPQPNGPLPIGIDDLAQQLDECGIACRISSDIHSPEALEFVRSQRADLGVVFGTRILKPDLYGIPTQGSINIHKRKVPEYRGGGEIGLWELLENDDELGVTVHRVADRVDTGAVVASTTLPIHRLDSLVGLGLKADVVGNDLLVESIRRFAAGTVVGVPQPVAGRTFKTPSPQRMRQLRKQLSAQRPSYRAERGRPLLKLIARSLAFAPYVVARNWIRRWRKSFPVTILYHHLVSDRPHRDGMPTEAFLQHVLYLRKHYRIVTMRDAVAMLATGKVDQPTIVLTFDDGYADNFLGLRAVVEEARVPVTLFISTQIVEQGLPFAHDVSSNHIDFLPLTPDQVVGLRRSGCEIGSHTRSHFDCGSTDAATLADEIVGSKRDLEGWLHEPIEYFSFPWGRPGKMSPEAVQIARRTYPFVFSAFGGQNYAAPAGAPWHLRRCVHPNDLWETELQLQGVLELGDPGIDIERPTAAAEPA